MPENLLAIDNGTQSVRALLFDPVRDVEAVRDFLYAKLRGVRHDAEARPAAQAPAADAVLVEIRDALTAAAKALEAKR